MFDAFQKQKGYLEQVIATNAYPGGMYVCAECENEVTVNKGIRGGLPFFSHKRNIISDPSECSRYVAGKTTEYKKAEAFESKLKLKLQFANDQWQLYLVLPAINENHYETISMLAQYLDFKLIIDNLIQVHGSKLHPSQREYCCPVEPHTGLYKVEINKQDIQLPELTEGADGLQECGTFFEYPEDGGSIINPYRGIVPGCKLCLVAKSKYLPSPECQWPKELNSQLHSVTIKGWNLWTISIPQVRIESIDRWLGHWNLSTQRRGFKMNLVSPSPMYYEENGIAVLSPGDAVLECRLSTGMDFLVAWMTIDGKKSGKTFRVDVLPNNYIYFIKIENLPVGYIEIRSLWAIGGKLAFYVKEPHHLLTCQFINIRLKVETIDKTHNHTFNPMGITLQLNRQDIKSIVMEDAPEGFKSNVYLILNGSYRFKWRIENKVPFIPFEMIKESYLDGILIDASNFGYIIVLFQEKSFHEWLPHCLWLMRKLKHENTFCNITNMAKTISLIENHISNINDNKIINLSENSLQNIMTIKKEISLIQHSSKITTPLKLQLINIQQNLDRIYSRRNR